MKIAIVEDEVPLASLLSDYLVAAGYVTQCFHDGAVALRSLKQESVDLVLLDLMLPGCDGITLCRNLRQFSDVPVIMLTARAEEVDRLLGLEVGADDYICKPFSPREVVARVKAVLRRYHSKLIDSPDSLLTLDLEAATVVYRNHSCELTLVELTLFNTLYREPGKIFNRSTLKGDIYSDHRVVSDRTVDSHIKKLRQKLQTLGLGVEVIHSVYGVGYKFEVPLPAATVQ